MFNREYPESNSHLKVLYHRTTCVTARNLARALGIGYAKTPSPEDVVAVRWGSSVEHNNDIALNPPEAVSLASNGLEALKVLHETGVPCVQIIEEPPEDEELYPLIARSRINHVAGKDIEFVTSYEEAVRCGAKYFTAYRQADKELRVHVFDGEGIRVFRKVPRENDADMIVKTSERGWGYHITNHEKYYHRAQRIAVDAVKALGLVTGGVDMGWNEHDRDYFVFEVNSGPALNSVTLEHYADRFRDYLEECGCEYERIEPDVE